MPDSNQTLQHHSNNLSTLSQYPLGDVSFNPELMGTGYTNYFKSLKKSKRSVEKILLHERINGKFGSGFANSENSPYLEHNAQTGRDLKNDLSYVLNLSNCCKKSAVWFVGDETGDQYIKQIECRKQWCPDCGGKGGSIHQNRKHAIYHRVDVTKYNLRQFVFTVPDSIREYFNTLEKLNELIKMARSVIEKFFGQPLLDKHGHVNSYKLQNGVIAYLHVLGDEDQDFNPHVNIHVFENKSTILKLSEYELKKIKGLWLKKLQKIDSSINVCDVHYLFKIKDKQKNHAIKYMCRPLNADQIDACSESIKRLLVLDLVGFQYLRFWGNIANCNYKDEMIIDLDRIKQEKKITENLTIIGISDFDLESWKSKLIKLDYGLYRRKRRGELCPAGEINSDGVNQ